MHGSRLRILDIFCQVSVKRHRCILKKNSTIVRDHMLPGNLAQENINITNPIFEVATNQSRVHLDPYLIRINGRPCEANGLEVVVHRVGLFRQWSGCNFLRTVPHLSAKHRRVFSMTGNLSLLVPLRFQAPPQPRRLFLLRQYRFLILLCFDDGTIFICR
jgi:hypothetical protein